MSRPIRVEMHLGDCLQIMPKIPTAVINLIVADLPYSVTACDWDIAHDLASLWVNFNSLQAAQSVCAMTCVQPFTTDLIVSNRKKFLYDIVWKKSRCSNFMQAKRRPMRQHETILIFADKKHTYNPQKTPGRIRRDENKRKVSGFVLNPTFYKQDGSGLKHPTTVLEVDEEETTTSSIARFHPTQKPVALLEWLIRAYSNAGDTVLDPVSGSATTAVAAIRTGRNVVCIEKDSDYFSIGVERVKAQVRASGVKAEVVVYDKPKMSQAS